MKLIRTKEVAKLPAANPDYNLTDLSLWNGSYYYLPQARFLVRIKYEVN